MTAAAESETDLVLAVSALLGRWSGSKGLRHAMHQSPTTDVYLVGGAIRDIVIDRHHKRKDFDFVICGDDASRFFGVLEENGSLSRNAFGLPRWTPRDSDLIYADVLPLDQFDTGVGRCAGIEDVLMQFDFTANAQAFDLRRHGFYDPIEGRKDALRRTMKIVRMDYPDDPIAPGSGLTRLGVVWIRIIHYAAELGFSIEPGTRDWLRSNARYIKQKDEFARTLFVPNLQLAARL